MTVAAQRRPLEQSVAPAETIVVGRDRIGPWSAYFALKAALFFADRLDFDLFWNAAFAVALLATHTQRRDARLLRWTRNTLACAAGLALLWRDSWLPPLPEVLSYVRQEGLPSAAYCVQLLGRAAASWELLAAAVIVALISHARRRVHLTWPVALLFFFVALRQTYHRPAGMDGKAAAFFDSEAGRVVRFAGPAAEIDVVVLHLCSLSTDDLRLAKLEDHPFWSRFDLLLTRFNTATSHSGPAALRLLRAPCGQARHEALYKPFSDRCSLTAQLRKSGYDVWMAHDHDGLFQGFNDSLIRYGGAPPMLSQAGLAPRAHNFDGSAIFDAAQVLDRYWRARLESGKPRAALYSNLVALHVGAHADADGGWWRKSRDQRYREAFASLSAAIGGFMDEIAASSRTAVVVVVPEHGAALRGTSMQLGDLRELPLPYLTQAPVAVAVVGPGRPRHAPVRLDEPVSYLAVAKLVAELTRDPALGADPRGLEALAARLPRTAPLSENQSAMVLQDRGLFYMKAGPSAWRAVPEDALTLPRETQP